MSGFKYQPYEKAKITHFDKTNGFDYHFALCDENYAQVTQFTYNRLYIIEAIRLLHLGLTKNPYEDRAGEADYVRQPITSFSMFEDCPIPRGDFLRIVFRTHDHSQGLFAYRLKRGLRYLNLFEEALGFDLSENTIFIDKLSNYFFFTSDKRWFDNPFLLDLYFHVVNCGESVLLGDSLPAIMYDAEYGIKDPNMSINMLNTHKDQILEICYNPAKYFQGKDFWRKSFNTFQYTYTYNLTNLLAGALRKRNMDEGVMDMVERWLLAQDIPF
jgi:hypothetical protein